MLAATLLLLLAGLQDNVVAQTYPAPIGTGAGDWAAAYQKAQALVSNMTLLEMNNLTYGYAVTFTGCSGVSGSVPRLGFPGFCLQDAGNGVRASDGVSAFSSGVSVGAAFNTDLAYERGYYMGAEFKKKGVNIALGPVVGPIGRIAEGGRNWEGFAADPYVDGILGALTVRGMQENVITSVKHYVAYEQESNRLPVTLNNVTVASTSANLDDATLHELYAWPFQDMIYAGGAGCIMCSYNRINNTYACENSKTLNDVLKREFDFQGFVVSDWGGQQSGLPSANGGLDMAMPNGAFWGNGALAQAVGNGTFNRTRLVDMATRIVATWYQMGQDAADFPKLGVGIPPSILHPHTYVDAKDPASAPSLLQQAIEGHVLVKNVNNTLPLVKPRVLSIFGYDAVEPATFDPQFFNYNGAMLPIWADGWTDVSLTTDQVARLYARDTNNPPTTANGLLWTGGGSGSNTPPYIDAPYDAIAQRARADGTTLFHDFSAGNPYVVASSDACLVFINEFASEDWDRVTLANSTSDQLVLNVAANCSNTIVVIHNTGIRLVDAWIDNANVTAVIYAHLPGQDAGTAIANILYGDVSPSGRMPYTVAKQASDYGDLLGPCPFANGSTTTSPQCNFTEGVNIDYRSFLARNITPRYEFGYGLTYTNFTYTGPLNIGVCGLVAGSANKYNNNNSTVGVGGNGSQASLFESVGTITFTLKNTGGVAAAEVAQLYLQIPGASTAALRGFQKVTLAPNALTTVSFNLRRKDVSRWDTVSQAWVVPSGTFGVSVGKSVLDTQLTGTFTVA